MFISHTKIALDAKHRLFISRRIARCFALFCTIIMLWAGCGSSEEVKPPPPDMTIPPDTAPPRPAEFTSEMLIEACARLSACGINRHPMFQECINTYHDLHIPNGRRLLYETLYHCANLGQGSCKIIRECLGFAGRPATCETGYRSECDGNIAQTCDYIAGWEQELDCAKGELKCGVMDTGEERVAKCGGGTCDPGAPTAECRNNRLYICVGNAMEIKDCQGQGLQCRDPMLGYCEGTGRSCAPASDKCKGNVLIECVNGYLHETDCTKLPGKKTCDATTRTCRGAGTECAVEADFDTCEGDKLVVCIDGYQHKIDCKELGFLGCEKADTYGAYCKAEPVYE